jgi:hypothetical protein
MGAGILPVTMYKGKLYFLFGKEVKDNKWGDFGGGTEHKESKFQTAIREGYEELDGFLGSQHQLKALVNSNYVTELEHLKYKVFLFKLDYDKNLPIYFKNHHQFIKKHFPEEIKEKNGLFEKSEIGWWSLEDMKRGKHKFRIFYLPIIDLIIKNANHIMQNV